MIIQKSFLICLNLYQTRDLEQLFSIFLKTAILQRKN